MQNCDEFKVIHIHKLSCDEICPVFATNRLVRKFNLSADDPLFIYYILGEKVILTAFKVCNVLTKPLEVWALSPKIMGSIFQKKWS